MTVTGKKESSERLSQMLDVNGPTSVGGTLPKEWLRSVASAVGVQPVDGSKRDLLRSAIETVGGVWNTEFYVEKGSTVSGRGIAYLLEAVELRQRLQALLGLPALPILENERLWRLAAEQLNIKLPEEPSAAALAKAILSAFRIWNL